MQQLIIAFEDWEGNKSPVVVSMADWNEHLPIPDIVWIFTSEPFKIPKHILMFYKHRRIPLGLISTYIFLSDSSHVKRLFSNFDAVSAWFASLDRYEYVFSDKHIVPLRHATNSIDALSKRVCFQRNRYEECKGSFTGKTAYIVGSGTIRSDWYKTVREPGSVMIGVGKTCMNALVSSKADFLITDSMDLWESEWSYFFSTVFLLCDKTPLLPLPDNFVFRSSGTGGDRDELHRTSYGGVTSSAFPAALFSMYMGCTTVYLVGCSCDVGRFYDKEQVDYSHLIKGWRELKSVAALEYPAARIVAVDPVVEEMKELFPN